MKRTGIVAAVTMMVAAGGMLAGQAAGVAEGIYSADQAKRGRTSYDRRCASCHEGGSMGPELTGSGFRTGWQGKTAGAFYTRVIETMPADAPGTLSAGDTLDIVAYVLQSNGFPAGSRDIASPAELETVSFTP